MQIRINRFLKRQVLYLRSYSTGFGLDSLLAATMWPRPPLCTFTLLPARSALGKHNEARTDEEEEEEQRAACGRLFWEVPQAALLWVRHESRESHQATDGH